MCNLNELCPVELKLQRSQLYVHHVVPLYGFIGSFEVLLYMTLLALYSFVCMLTVYVVLKGISATQLIVALIAIKANSVAVAVVIVAEVTFESYSVVLCTLVLV